MRKSILLIAGAALLFTGCQNTQKTSEQPQTKVETKGEITAANFEEKIQKIDKALVIAGDPKNDEFKKAYDELKPIAKELKVDLHTVDVSGKDNAELRKKYALDGPSDVMIVKEGTVSKLGGGKGLPPKSTLKQILDQEIPQEVKDQMKKARESSKK
ncbi:hypothetical protein [Xylocopilactobacillus apicola]|uniref:Lipoprotein n=1 Tax=Xylocopilactobacillus apicola TaxID=2932184 RepID=A0AAU9DRQ3_9LACO|nr:hypothetical protein [Xylocopilactobacillus apicola]BDR57863.1 hypothetical protein XA3_03040 [Xylocopilactobacillus apicola]